MRLTNNSLCILLGVPPEELRRKLGPSDPKRPIPSSPLDVAVGIPADLVRRRPDVRRAERQAAAQCAQIGYAESDFYPHISIIGTIGLSAEKFRNLFNQDALTGGIGPSFQWNILNYARIINNVRVQDATFQQLVAQYQNTVLTAQKEVEDGLVTFLKAQQRVQEQEKSVENAKAAHKILLDRYKTGAVQYAQVLLILQNLTVLQDTLAQAQGEIPTGLIMVYKALGGGWQLRETGCDMPGGRPFEGDPLHQHSRFLPYPRILRESPLPVVPQASQVPTQEFRPRPQPPLPPQIPTQMERLPDPGMTLPAPQPMMKLGIPEATEALNLDDTHLPVLGPIRE